VEYPTHPLTEAAQFGHLEVVEVLLEAGADPNALMTLEKIKKFSNRVYELILDDYSPEEAKTNFVYSPLLFASEKGYPGIAEALLEAGADPHIKGPGYLTPLHKAARSGNVEVLKVLLEHGGDVNIYTSASTPLGQAALNGRLEAVKFLVKNGADVNKTFKRVPHTALGLASYNCWFNVVEYLLKNGAKPTLKGHPINYAVDLGSITNEKKEKKYCKKVIQLLLEAGVDPNKRNKIGKTAFDYATDEEIKQLLQKYADNREGTQN
jgi:ankyrin repeat protein